MYLILGLTLIGPNQGKTCSYLNQSCNRAGNMLIHWFGPQDHFWWRMSRGAGGSSSVAHRREDSYHVPETTNVHCESFQLQPLICFHADAFLSSEFYENLWISPSKLPHPFATFPCYCISTSLNWITNGSVSMCFIMWGKLDISETRSLSSRSL